MRCTRCHNYESEIEGTCKIKYMSDWKVPEGSGWKFKTWADTATRWKIGLCSNCAVKSYRNALDEEASEITGFLVAVPAIIILIIALSCIFIFGMLTGLIGMGIMLLYIVVAVPLYMFRLVRIKKEMKKVKEGDIVWNKENLTSALFSEASRLLEKVKISENENIKKKYPLPVCLKKPPVFYDKDSEWDGYEYRVISDNWDQLPARLKTVIAFKQSQIRSLTANDIEQLQFNVLPVCTNRICAEEKKALDLLCHSIKQNKFRDERNQNIMEALGNCADI